MNTVCISLDRRSDRKEGLLDAIDEWPFTPWEFFSAIDGGWSGCAASHLQVIQNASDEDQDSVLILEDDVLPLEGIGDQWKKVQEEIPNDLDMLFLGGQIPGIRYPYSKNLVRPYLIWRTHGYVVYRRAYKKLLAIDANTHIDLIYGAMCARGRLNVLCCQPWLFGVRGCSSDIRHK